MVCWKTLTLQNPLHDVSEKKLLRHIARYQKMMGLKMNLFSNVAMLGIYVSFRRGVSHFHGICQVTPNDSTRWQTTRPQNENSQRLVWTIISPKFLGT